MGIDSADGRIASSVDGMSLSIGGGPERSTGAHLFFLAIGELAIVKTAGMSVNRLRCSDANLKFGYSGQRSAVIGPFQVRY